MLFMGVEMNHMSVLPLNRLIKRQQSKQSEIAAVTL